MKIAIRKEPNGLVYMDKSALERFDEDTLKQEPYNYKIVDVEKKDCEESDFDDDLNFDIEKYNKRKATKSAIEKILLLKKKLNDTDYQAIKFAEGEMTEEEYSPIKTNRKKWREEIKKLGKEYNLNY